MPIATMQQLRRCAVTNSLFAPTTLRAAINKLGFVQADPIRSPATAQDLILRPRVNGYRAGDLENKYPVLNIEEDYVYAYGFMPRSTWRLLHPRDASQLPDLERKVLEVVRNSTHIHPADLEQHLGRERVVNAWGGYSKATTRALEHLHHRGLLRIAAREKGIRIYEAAPIIEAFETNNSSERLSKLVLLLANIFAPAPRKSFQETVNKLRYSFSGTNDLRTIIDKLIQSEELKIEILDGEPYVYPYSLKIKRDMLEEVRILAPFDPVVWDRRRFEHLWGWAYRFEAYTPQAKRVRGYYAMPLLRADSVIGWVNITSSAKGMTAEVGYATKRPVDAAFKRQLKEEIERMELFLKKN